MERPPLLSRIHPLAATATIRTDGHSACGGRDSPKAVTLNKVRDYRALEREYITSQVSLRELCRRHGISAHSLVVVQAKQGKWAEKREAYRARESDTFITKHADRMAAREAEVRIHAIDAIDEAITKFRSDMQRTERKLIGGEWVEVPVMMITPRDVALLIDRFQVLFARPSVISQHQGINVRRRRSPSRPSKRSSSRPVGWPSQPRRSHRSRDHHAVCPTDRPHLQEVGRSLRLAGQARPVAHEQPSEQRERVPHMNPMRGQPPTTRSWWFAERSSRRSRPRCSRIAG